MQQADDRISGQVKTKNTLSKWDNWILFGGNSIIAAFCAVIFFLMPWINSMEDEASHILSETLAGRWQIAINSIIPLLIFTLIPALISYIFSRLQGIEGGRPLKDNRAFKIALTAYFVLVLWGIVGAISFVIWRSPFNVFGF